MKQKKRWVIPQNSINYIEDEDDGETAGVEPGTSTVVEHPEENVDGNDSEDETQLQSASMQGEDVMIGGGN